MTELENYKALIVQLGNGSIYEGKVSLYALLDKEVSSIIKEKPNFVFEELSQPSPNQFFRNLYLVEYLRAYGLFYDSEDSSINKLLMIGIQSLELNEVWESERLSPFRVIKTILDIIFHQIDLFPRADSIQNNSNNETRELYVKLLENVLDEKFHNLIGKSEAYDGCIYFTMLIGFNEKYIGSSQTLKEKMQIHIPDGENLLDDPLYKSWVMNNGGE